MLRSFTRRRSANAAMASLVVRRRVSPCVTMHANDWVWAKDTGVNVEADADDETERINSSSSTHLFGEMGKRKDLELLADQWSQQLRRTSAMPSSLDIEAESDDDANRSSANQTPSASPVHMIRLHLTLKLQASESNLVSVDAGDVAGCLERLQRELNAPSAVCVTHTAVAGILDGLTSIVVRCNSSSHSRRMSDESSATANDDDDVLRRLWKGSLGVVRSLFYWSALAHSHITAENRQKAAKFLQVLVDGLLSGEGVRRIETELIRQSDVPSSQAHDAKSSTAASMATNEVLWTVMLPCQTERVSAGLLCDELIHTAQRQLQETLVGSQELAGNGGRHQLEEPMDDTSASTERDYLDAAPVHRGVVAVVLCDHLKHKALHEAQSVIRRVLAACRNAPYAHGGYVLHAMHAHIQVILESFRCASPSGSDDARTEAAALVSLRTYASGRALLHLGHMADMGGVASEWSPHIHATVVAPLVEETLHRMEVDGRIMQDDSWQCAVEGIRIALKSYFKAMLHDAIVSIDARVQSIEGQGGPRRGGLGVSIEVAASKLALGNVISAAVDLSVLMQQLAQTFFSKNGHVPRPLQCRLDEAWRLSGRHHGLALIEVPRPKRQFRLLLPDADDEVALASDSTASHETYATDVAHLSSPHTAALREEQREWVCRHLFDLYRCGVPVLPIFESYVAGLHQVGVSSENADDLGNGCLSAVANLILEIATSRAEIVSAKTASSAPRQPYNGTQRLHFVGISDRCMELLADVVVRCVVFHSRRAPHAAGAANAIRTEAVAEALSQVCRTVQEGFPLTSPYSLVLKWLIRQVAEQQQPRTVSSPPPIADVRHLKRIAVDFLRHFGHLQEVVVGESADAEHQKFFDIVAELNTDELESLKTWCSAIDHSKSDALVLMMLQSTMPRDLDFFQSISDRSQQSDAQDRLQQWNCVHCRSLNNHSKSSCSVCGALRHFLTQCKECRGFSSSTVSRCQLCGCKKHTTDAADSGKESAVVVPLRRWQCKSCKQLNPATHPFYCRSCLSPSHAAVATRALDAHSCGECGHVNPLGILQPWCVVCGTLHNNVTQGMAKLWNCPQCSQWTPWTVQHCRDCHAERPLNPHRAQERAWFQQDCGGCGCRQPAWLKCCNSCGESLASNEGEQLDAERTNATRLLSKHGYRAAVEAATVDDESDDPSLLPNSLLIDASVLSESERHCDRCGALSSISIRRDGDGVLECAHLPCVVCAKQNDHEQHIAPAAWICLRRSCLTVNHANRLSCESCHEDKGRTVMVLPFSGSVFSFVGGHHDGSDPLPSDALSLGSEILRRASASAPHDLLPAAIDLFADAWPGVCAQCGDACYLTNQSRICATCCGSDLWQADDVHAPLALWMMLKAITVIFADATRSVAAKLPWALSVANGALTAMERAPVTLLPWRGRDLETMRCCRHSHIPVHDDLTSVRASGETSESTLHHALAMSSAAMQQLLSAIANTEFALHLRIDSARVVLRWMDLVHKTTAFDELSFSLTLRIATVIYNTVHAQSCVTLADACVEALQMHFLTYAKVETTTLCRLVGVCRNCLSRIEDECACGCNTITASSFARIGRAPDGTRALTTQQPCHGQIRQNRTEATAQ